MTPPRWAERPMRGFVMRWTNAPTTRPRKKRRMPCQKRRRRRSTSPVVAQVRAQRGTARASVLAGAGALRGIRRRGLPPARRARAARRALARGGGRRDARRHRAERVGEDDGAEAGERAPHADHGRGARRGARDDRVGRDPAPAPDGLRDPGDGALPASHGGAERRSRARAGGLAARAHRTARRGAARAGRPAGGGVRRALPAPALRWAAPARRRGARAGRRPTVALVGRAVRRARSHHARRAAARIPGPAGAAAEDRDLRDARHARGGAGGRPDRGGGGRKAPRGRDAGGAAREPRPRGAGAGGRVMLHEVLVETGRHVMLVGVSVGLATAIGVPLGVWLTRRPGWSRIILGLASVLQTIPSLALFGFLIPVPWIGGIGVRTALVALTLYGLLPVLRNTVTGIAGVDPAIREAGRGMGMTDAQLLWRVELPLAASVIIAGVRVATVIGIGVATIAAAIGAGGLGVFIFRGVAMVDNRTILAGALPAAALAGGAELGRGAGGRPGWP